MKPAIYIGNLKNSSNRGTCIRTGEAFGINLVMSNDNVKKYKYSQGASKHMIFLKFETEEEVIGYCKENNHRIVCIEDCDEAWDIDKVNYPKNPLFITGNENSGVSKTFLNNAWTIVKIPQAKSYVRCLNTSVACSIAIQDWFNKNQKKLDKIKDENQKHGNVIVEGDELK